MLERSVCMEMARLMLFWTPWAMVKAHGPMVGNGRCGGGAARDWGGGGKRW